MKQEEVLDEGCQHELDAPTGQGLVGIHEVLEIVRVGGREIARRSEIHCCPDHLEAIRRARAFNDRFLGVVMRDEDEHRNACDCDECRAGMDDHAEVG